MSNSILLDKCGVFRRVFFRHKSPGLVSFPTCEIMKTFSNLQYGFEPKRPEIFKVAGTREAATIYARHHLGEVAWKARGWRRRFAFEAFKSSIY